MGELVRLHKLNNGRYSMTKTGTPTNLVCDEKTRIVYYKFTEKFTDGLRIEKSFFGPYYSENGKLCRFIKGKFVEVG